MRYNQPYGISDPNGSYVNGDPSIGRAGSIPPAASIEHPQREIVNLITDAAVIPNEADLHQLAKAIQSGKLIYADDTGTVNIFGLNCVPQVAELHRGMVFITKAAATNTGATVADVNGLTAPVVHASDRTALLPFDVNKDQMCALAFDGTNFQLVWSATGPKSGTGAGGALQANYEIYVNVNTGSDTLYDGSQATVGTAGHGPFKTIQHGVDVASKLNANGFVITIHVADGTYPETVSITNVTNGGLTIRGNVTTPAACQITGISPYATIIGVRGVGVAVWLEGFKLVNVNGPYLMTSQISSLIAFQNMDFGFCQSVHLLCDTGIMNVQGNYTISGNCQYHIICQYSNFVLTPSGYNTVTIVGGAQLGTTFAWATGIGFIRCNTRTNFVGGYASGSKFFVNANAVIDTGNAGVNFFPGATPGTVQTGGCYV